MTDSTVEIAAMPKELRSAAVKSEFCRMSL